MGSLTANTKKASEVESGLKTHSVSRDWIEETKEVPSGVLLKNEKRENRKGKEKTAV